MSVSSPAIAVKPLSLSVIKCCAEPATTVNLIVAKIPSAFALISWPPTIEEEKYPCDKISSNVESISSMVQLTFTPTIWLP